MRQESIDLADRAWVHVDDARRRHEWADSAGSRAGTLGWRSAGGHAQRGHRRERHQILGCLVAAYSLLGALSRVDPAAVDELLQRAIRLRARVSQPKAGSAETARRDEGADQDHGTGQ